MDKKEYRILEHQGLFYAQIKVETASYPIIKTGITFFDFILSPILLLIGLSKGIQVKTEWMSCTMNFPPTYFKTLDEAKAKITLLTTPDKVHEVTLLNSDVNKHKLLSQYSVTDLISESEALRLMNEYGKHMFQLGDKNTDGLYPIEKINLKNISPGPGMLSPCAHYWTIDFADLSSQSQIMKCANCGETHLLKQR